MSITRLVKNLNYNQELPDKPRGNEGYSSYAVKQIMDQAGNDIKTYINETLIPELETSKTEQDEAYATKEENNKKVDTETFNAAVNERYTKTEVDNTFATKTENNKKLDKSVYDAKIADIYTKGQVDNNFATKNELGGKLDKSTYNAQVINAGNSNAEIVDARGADAKLGDRLNKLDSSLAESTKQIKGSMISTFLPIDTIKRRNLTQVKNAIASNNCVVTFWGDSIVDNGDCISYFSNIRELLERKLIENFRSCAFTINNRAVGGRSVDNAANPNYLASSDPNVTTPNGYYAGWATVGQSWRDNVKDTAPDLLILHFGMNTYAGHQTNDSYQAIYDFVQTWTKIPTILIIPNFLPNPNWATDWIYRLEAQRTARYFAENKNLPCADIGRVHRLLRDGVDETGLIATKKETDLSLYSKASCTDITNGFRINAGGQIVSTYNDLLNFEFKFQFQYTGVESFMIHYIRNKYNIRYTPSAGILQLKNTATNAVIDSFTAPVPTNGLHTLTIKVYGSKVRVELAFNFTTVLEGLEQGLPYYVGVKPITGTVDITNPALTKYEGYKITPVLEDKDFLGDYIVGDLTTKIPYGGNGVNHPSSKGVQIMYEGEFQKLIDAL